MCLSLTVNNQSGATQTVAVFQVSSPSSGLSLVWQIHTINDNSNYEFTWKTNWGLGWGTTSIPFGTGSLYQSSQLIPQPVQPNQANGNNELLITYANSNFSSTGPTYNQQLQSGVMQIITDTSFTVGDSLNMIVAVYMDDKPILVSQGKPNYQYQFNTNINYYLTVTDYNEGQVMPSLASLNINMIRNIAISTGMSWSSPTKVDFNNQTKATYNLDSILTFKKVSV